MKIATVGCSHSSYFAGTPWPVFLSQELNCKLEMGASAGAGNEMNIEKVRSLLNRSPNLVIVQLTHPGRFVVGLDDLSCKPRVPDTSIQASHYSEGSYHYTFNAFSNVENLTQLLGVKCHHGIDKFIINHVLPSNYNLYYKILHTMSTISFMCDKKKIPLVFFSWAVDIHEIIVKCNYQEMFKDLKIIPSYIEEFVLQNNLKPIPNNGHHGPENHKIITDKYILPYLKKMKLV